MPNAIISVYDKTNLKYLGEILEKQNFRIYATAGTLKVLKENGIKAFHVEEISSNPIGFDKFFSSLSFNTMIGTLAEDVEQFSGFNITKIDLVVFNFVPTWSEINGINDFNIQNVDLGGPTMIKSAAINFKHVIPVVNPDQYGLLKDIKNITLRERIKFAATALEYCSCYDRKLALYLRDNY